MVTRCDLVHAITTTFEHTATGGVAMFKPDFVAETFGLDIMTGGSDAKGRGLRYLEWRWIPDAAHGTCATDMAYVLRDEAGAIKVLHDHHTMGLFSRAVSLEMIAAAGFEPVAFPFEHTSCHESGHERFLGLRPARNDSDEIEGARNGKDEEAK